jgi:hypothetical protein
MQSVRALLGLAQKSTHLKVKGNVSLARALI